MRAVVYPASNVIFTAQSDDPATVKPAAQAIDVVRPAHEHIRRTGGSRKRGVALAESANLLIIPRVCGNGRPAPVQNADWQMWVQELRDAGMAAYKAAQTRSQDAILEAASTVGDACLHCHQKYRQVPGGFANRC